MIVSKNVELGGIKLKKWYSDNLKKIKCNEDNNIYSAAYTSRDANLSFEETNLPLNEITSGAIISVDDVWGLSDFYVQKTELSGYATTQAVEDLSSEISTKSSIFVQGEYSPSLSVSNVSEKEYYNVLSSGPVPPNSLYVISSNVNDQMGEKITNLGEASDLSDAMPMWQIKRDFISKESLVATLSGLNQSSTIGQMLNALTSLTVIE